MTESAFDRLTIDKPTVSADRNNLNFLAAWGDEALDGDAPDIQSGSTILSGFEIYNSDTIDVQLAERGEARLTGSTESKTPRDAVRDEHGNLTEYVIGPEGDESAVKVDYSDAAGESDTVTRLELKRPGNGETIVYERERSDPQDASSPFVYSETRNGMRGSILYADFNVDADGRINLYFDFDRKRTALSFNPATGEEEYP